MNMLPRILALVVRFQLLVLMVWSLELSAKWEKLQGCRWVTHASNDGDSFRVKTADGRSFQFRLYFVDTPEDNYFYPERVRDQAAYFGIDPKEVLKVGEEGSQFTKHFLAGQRFTVWTEWENAWGAQKRYAALVYRGDAEDESLIEALVANGLVRIRGFQTGSRWCDRWTASEYQSHLLKLEQVAKSKGLGGWKRTGRVDRGLSSMVFGGDGSSKVGGSISMQRGPSGEGAVNDARPVDLNGASEEVLQSLPGIGAVLARRIVNARPFSSVRELVQVQGIGDKLLDKVEPLVVLGFAGAPQKTAAYYLKDPLEWSGREIELSICSLERSDGNGPDGFTRFSARTSFDNRLGGDIPLYLDDEWLENAIHYFNDENQTLVLRVRFFRYCNEWVTVFRK